MDGTTLTIGQLAEAAGVHLETVRYYERRGLLPEPPRSAAGYRLYGLDDVDRLRLITRAKALGFTLREVGALLDDDARGPEQVLAAVERKLADLEVRQQELEQTRRRLLVLSERCADGDDAGCSSLAT